jgi:hypothetical protein
MDCLCKFLDKINQKLEAIDVDFLKLSSKNFVVGINELLVDKLHLFPSETAYIGEIVDIIVVPGGGVEIERNLC